MTDFIVDSKGNVTPTADFDPAVMVGEFIRAFEMPPTVDLWLKLVAEEKAELLEAMALDVTDGTLQALSNVLKEACDLLYVFAGLGLNLDHFHLAADDTLCGDVETLLSNVLYVVGEQNFEEAFRRVHASNMSKLGDDGKPVRREDGKVLKGPNYAPPVLTDLVTEAYTQSNPNPEFLVNA